MPDAPTNSLLLKEMFEHLNLKIVFHVVEKGNNQ